LLHENANPAQTLLIKIKVPIAQEKEKEKEKERERERQWDGWGECISSVKDQHHILGSQSQSYNEELLSDRTPEWCCGLRHCISVQEASLQTLV
jgi:hypothetical protein